MPFFKNGGETSMRGDVTTSIVSVRLTPSERQALSIKADSAQMALSAFMRVCALSALDEAADAASNTPKAKRVSNTQRTQIALILACMGRLMDAVQAFSDDPVSPHDQDHMLDILKRDIRETRDQCFAALRRKA